ncbi:Fc.00g072230.m01.CDS01 [Cosmosporella sp. VM-42]
MESPFTLSAQPNTDIWKKPPSHDVFTAPFRPHSIAPLNHFLSATLTFTTTYIHQFDQAGLLLIFTSTSPSKNPARKWIKTGIEFFNSQTRYSTVCCDRWADWSVAGTPHSKDIQEGKRSVTVRVERQGGADGLCLWAYVLDGGEKVPLREIAWVYGDNPEEWELEVSAAVARPGKEIDGELEVQFENFEVEWEKPGV